MYQWILNLLGLKKTIFCIAIALIVINLLGLVRLNFDYEMRVTNDKKVYDQMILVAVYDAQLFSPAHFKQLAALQNEFTALNSVKKVNSLYTAFNLRRYLDENQSHSILEDKPYAQDDLAELKSDMLDNQLLVGKFVSKNADTMLFYLTIPNDKLGKKSFEVRDEIQEVLDRHRSDFSRIFQLGIPELTHNYIKKTRHDFMICVPLVFILMAILFGWLFRNIFLFALPCFSAVFGLICGLGMMGWFGIPVSALFLAAVVLTLAIGVAESAHIIHAYQKSMRLHPSFTLKEHYANILKTVLVPFLLAVFSALLGFMFDVLSFVPVVVHAAYALAFCIAFNTAASIFISPLFLPHIKVKLSQDRMVFNYLAKNLLHLNAQLLSHRRWVFVVLLCLGIAGFASFESLHMESLPYAFVQKSDPLMKNLYFVDKKVAAQNVVQVDIFSKDKNAFLVPKYLQLILDSEKKLLKIPHTTQAYSLCDVVATANEIFMFNNQRFFKIPVTQLMLKEIIKQIEAQGIAHNLVNKDYNQLHLFLNYSMYTSVGFSEYKKNIENVLTTSFQGSSLHFKVIDYQVEFIKAVNNLLVLQIISIFSIYLICFITVGMMFRSLLAGIASVIPNIFPLCVISIVQYACGIPISSFTVILYSIVVGLSVDETIHIFYAYKEQCKLLHDKSQAISTALNAQVIPVTVASTAIAISWLVLLFSQFLPVFQLGFLCAIGVVSAWFADLVITPFLLGNANITKRLISF